MNKRYARQIARNGGPSEYKILKASIPDKELVLQQTRAAEEKNLQESREKQEELIKRSQAQAEAQLLIARGDYDGAKAVLSGGTHSRTEAFDGSLDPSQAEAMVVANLSPEQKLAREQRLAAMHPAERRAQTYSEAVAILSERGKTQIAALSLQANFLREAALTNPNLNAETREEFLRQEREIQTRMLDLERETDQLQQLQAHITDLVDQEKYADIVKLQNGRTEFQSLVQFNKPDDLERLINTEPKITLAQETKAYQQLMQIAEDAEAITTRRSSRLATAAQDSEAEAAPLQATKIPIVELPVTNYFDRHLGARLEAIAETEGAHARKLSAMTTSMAKTKKEAAKLFATGDIRGARKLLSEDLQTFAQNLQDTDTAIARARTDPAQWQEVQQKMQASYETARNGLLMAGAAIATGGIATNFIGGGSLLSAGAAGASQVPLTGLAATKAFALGTGSTVAAGFIGEFSGSLASGKSVKESFDYAASQIGANAKTAALGSLSSLAGVGLGGRVAARLLSSRASQALQTFVGSSSGGAVGSLPGIVDDIASRAAQRQELIAELQKSGKTQAEIDQALQEQKLDFQSMSIAAGASLVSGAASGYISGLSSSASGALKQSLSRGQATLAKAAIATGEEMTQIAIAAAETSAQGYVPGTPEFEQAMVANFASLVPSRVSGAIGARIDADNHAAHKAAEDSPAVDSSHPTTETELTDIAETTASTEQKLAEQLLTEAEEQDLLSEAELEVLKQDLVEGFPEAITGFAKTHPELAPRLAMERAKQRAVASNHSIKVDPKASLPEGVQAETEIIVHPDGHREAIIRFREGIIDAAQKGDPAALKIYLEEMHRHSAATVPDPKTMSKEEYIARRAFEELGAEIEAKKTVAKIQGEELSKLEDDVYGTTLGKLAQAIATKDPAKIQTVLDAIQNDTKLRPSSNPFDPMITEADLKNYEQDYKQNKARTEEEGLSSTSANSGLAKLAHAAPSKPDILDRALAKQGSNFTQAQHDYSDAVERAILTNSPEEVLGALAEARATSGLQKEEARAALLNGLYRVAENPEADSLALDIANGFAQQLDNTLPGSAEKFTQHVLERISSEIHETGEISRPLQGAIDTLGLNTETQRILTDRAPGSEYQRIIEEPIKRSEETIAPEPAPSSLTEPEIPEIALNEFALEAYDLATSDSTTGSIAKYEALMERLMDSNGSSPAVEEFSRTAAELGLDPGQARDEISQFLIDNDQADLAQSFIQSTNPHDLSEASILTGLQSITRQENAGDTSYSKFIDQLGSIPSSADFVQEFNSRAIEQGLDPIKAREALAQRLVEAKRSDLAQGLASRFTDISQAERGRVRRETELDAKDLQQQVVDQQMAIKTENIEAILSKYEGAERELAERVLSHMTQFANPEGLVASHKQLMSLLKDDGVLYSLSHGTMTDLYEYMAGKGFTEGAEQIKAFDNPDNALDAMIKARKQEGTTPYLLVDQATLQALRDRAAADPLFIENLQKQSIRLIIPEGWDSGVNLYTQDSAEAKLRELVTKVQESSDLSAPITDKDIQRSLREDIKNELQALGFNFDGQARDRTVLTTLRRQDLDHRDNDPETLAARFAATEPSVEDIQRALSRIPSRETDRTAPAREILAQQLQVLSARRRAIIAREMNQRIEAKAKELGIAPENIVYYIPQARQMQSAPGGRSGRVSTMAYALANGIPSRQITSNLDGIKDIEGKKLVVVLDDFSGSGGRASEYYRTLERSGFHG
ncbi:MAG: hypothetical protein O3C63_05090, partial [Cyanobacteria bacterium]|nr:hypothetical protein [Cyanobacteriota bacterium]